MEKLKILVVDDESRMRKLVRDFLVREDYEVLEAGDGEAALDIFYQEKNIALIILDVMMPKMDGIHATLQIREQSSIPIIILSAKTEDSDKILGLNVGADDYVTKPFNPLELVARVNSQIRRYTEFGNNRTDRIEDDGIYTIRGLTIDDRRKTVTVEGKTVKMTPIEYNILIFLVKNAVTIKARKVPTE